MPPSSALQITIPFEATILQDALYPFHHPANGNLSTQKNAGIVSQLLEGLKPAAETSHSPPKGAKSCRTFRTAGLDFSWNP